MAKENTFLKNLSGISNAITSVTEIIGDRKSGGTSQKAMDEDAEDNSIKIIDSVDKLEEWIVANAGFKICRVSSNVRNGHRQHYSVSIQGFRVGGNGRRKRSN